MTVKELADTLNVSKPTISKAVSELGLNLDKIGNRFVLSDEQVEMVKSKISQIGDSQKLEKTQKTETEITQKTENITPNSQNSFLESQILFLQKQLEEKDKQIQEKDSQLKEKDKQIEKLLDTNAELNKSVQQAHTLQYQQQQIAVSDADTVEPTATEQVQEQPKEKKKGIFSRLFGKR